jgi:hypothetical protein
MGLWALHTSPAKSALILGVGSLLGLSSMRAGTLDVPWMFLLAQTFHGMADPAAFGSLGFIQLSIATVALLSHFPTFRREPGLFTLLIVLVTIHTALTPLSSSVIGLAGIFLLSIYGVGSPQAITTSHSHLAHGSRRNPRSSLTHQNH